MLAKRMHFIVSIQNAIKVMGEGEIAKIITEEKWDRAIICNDGEYRNFKHGDILVMPRRKDKKK